MKECIDRWCDCEIGHTFPHKPYQHDRLTRPENFALITICNCRLPFIHSVAQHRVMANNSTKEPARYFKDGKIITEKFIPKEMRYKIERDIIFPETTPERAECRGCNLYFVDTEGLIQHMLDTHGEKYQ